MGGRRAFEGEFGVSNPFAGILGLKRIRIMAFGMGMGRGGGGKEMPSRWMRTITFL